MPMLSFKSKPRASIVILVRTKDRASLLKRAIGSIQKQTYSDWHIMLLNDGGKSQEVVQVLEELDLTTKKKCTLIHLPANESDAAPPKSGRPLNIGIERSSSEFLAIHDDDDTWRPEFLQQSIEKIRSSNSDACVTACNRIFERWNGKEYEEVSRELYNPWQIHGISLFRLAESNTYPPIASVFKRSVQQEIGPFAEHVLEDWLFHLKLSAKYEVSFLRTPLANYHARIEGAREFSDENVCSKFSDVLGEAELKIRNDLLKEDLASGRKGLGFLVNLSRASAHLYSEIQSLKD